MDLYNILRPWFLVRKVKLSFSSDLLFLPMTKIKKPAALVTFLVVSAIAWPTVLGLLLKTTYGISFVHLMTRGNKSYEASSVLSKFIEPIKNGKVLTVEVDEGGGDASLSNGVLRIRRNRIETQDAISIVRAVELISDSKVQFLIHASPRVLSDHRPQYPTQDIKYFGYFVADKLLPPPHKTMELAFKLFKDFAVKHKNSELHAPPKSSLGATFNLPPVHSIASQRKLIKSAKKDLYRRLIWSISNTDSGEIRGYPKEFAGKACFVESFGVIFFQESESERQLISSDEDFSKVPDCNFEKN